MLNANRVSEFGGLAKLVELRLLFSFLRVESLEALAVIIFKAWFI